MALVTAGPVSMIIPITISLMALAGEILLNMKGEKTK